MFNRKIKISFVNSGNALKCWNCRSDWDINCADPFNNITFPLEWCDVRGENYRCRTIKRQRKLNLNGLLTELFLKFVIKFLEDKGRVLYERECAKDEEDIVDRAETEVYFCDVDRCNEKPL